MQGPNGFSDPLHRNSKHTDCDGNILESNVEIAERPDLTNDEKQANLGGNAKRLSKHELNRPSSELDGLNDSASEE